VKLKLLLIEPRLKLKPSREPKLLNSPELKLFKELNKKDFKFKQELRQNKPREN
jgi:hypothetical protein